MNSSTSYATWLEEDVNLFYSVSLFSLFFFQEIYLLKQLVHVSALMGLSTVCILLIVWIYPVGSFKMFL